MENKQFNKKSTLQKAIVVAVTAGTLVFGVAANADWIRSSQVTDIVTDNGDGTWDYEFTVINTSIWDDISELGSSQIPLIIDWELPYFADMGITSVLSPDGWNWAVETIGTANVATGWDGVAAWQDPSDPFYEGATSPYTTGTEVLHWYCDPLTLEGGEGLIAGCGVENSDGIFEGSPIWPSDGQSGFGFTANYAPTGAPYQASWAELPVLTGDPAFPVSGVGSPSVIGNTAPPVSVPEPGILGLIGLGLLGMFGARRKKQA